MTAKRKADAAEQVQAPAIDSKRSKTSHDHTGSFAPSLFSTLESQKSAYASSTPYLHGVIPTLVADPLLRAVRDEIRSHITFTPKETDIYKIHQSGDLANLDGLDAASLEKLPSLVKLRDALYSEQFRGFLEEVTGSGKLSGQKTDMAVNVYTPGCHLLCHDDVIGTRRVSYILYLTDPERPWQASWGGGLRLYPTETVTAPVEANGSSNTAPGGKQKNKTKKPAEREFKIPHHTPTKTIPPAWNQLSFFAVQPGESFHDVEEVYARSSTDPGEDVDGGRIRMAISGWFHIPQDGEDGFVAGAAEAQAERSSLAQLQGKSADRFDKPQARWRAHDDGIAHGEDDGLAPEFTEEEMELLVRYLNPRYLVPDTVEELQEAFTEDASLRLGEFLNPKMAEKVKAEITSADADAASRTKIEKGWDVACPPHKARYLFRQPNEGGKSASTPTLAELTDILFPSGAFRKWLSHATNLSLDACNVLARRFRRGMDYTLATGYEAEEPQLEASLGLTPSLGWGASEGADDEEEEEDGPLEGASSAASAATNGKKAKAVEDNTDNEPEGGVGGYELYMAGDDDDDDEDDEETGSNDGIDVPLSSKKPSASTHTGAGKRRERPDPAIYRSAEDHEDDGIMLSVPAEWNCLTVALRDRGTMRFVKYVSHSAKGDRWDLCGEWMVDGTLDDGDSDEDNGDDEDADEAGDSD